MDPVSAQAANLVSAVQALLVRQGAVMEGPALMTLLGQDVEMLFQALAPGGVKLQLPSGQTVIAQGELPYPEGTQLRVRILPAATGETGLRLQLQEARPPAPPAILAPLFQGEAQILAARLAQDPPSPELAPLMRLLNVLAEAPPPALPTQAQIQIALQELPEALVTSLGRILEGPVPLATALQSLLQDPQAEGSIPTGAANRRLRPEVALALALNPEQEATKLEASVQQVIARIETMMAQHAAIPEGQKGILATWIRDLLQKAAGTEEPSLQIPKGTLIPRADSRPTPSANAPPPALPTQVQIEIALQELPEALVMSLKRILVDGQAPSSTRGAVPITGRLSAEKPVNLATALQTLFQDPQKASANSTDQLALALAPEQEAIKLEAFVQQVVARIETLMTQRAVMPEGHKDILATWIRNLLQKAAETGELPPPIAKSVLSPREESRQTSATDALVPPRLLSALQTHTGSKAEIPESWESWIRGTVTTLTSPSISPREAAFHAVQAKEGTAYFEIPLPWAQATPLQIWVEADAPEERKGGRDSTKRVLLGLKFSNLGETRLGMAQGTFGLQIRIWTEHPESLEHQRERMEKELEELGKAVDLKIYALNYGPDGTIPTLRSRVVGPSLSALG